MLIGRYLYIALYVMIISLLPHSGSAQPFQQVQIKLQLGETWKNLSQFYGDPFLKTKWGEKGRVLFFNRDGSELQIYLSAEDKVEGFLTLYSDGVEMGKRKDIMNALSETDGVFVKVADEKDHQLIKFQGMAYIKIDKNTNIASFLLTGPKHGYLYLYVEATYYESELRRFNRQIFEQIRKKVRWSS